MRKKEVFVLSLVLLILFGGFVSISLFSDFLDKYFERDDLSDKGTITQKITANAVSLGSFVNPDDIICDTSPPSTGKYKGKCASNLLYAQPKI